MGSIAAVWARPPRPPTAPLQGFRAGPSIIAQGEPKMTAIESNRRSPQVVAHPDCSKCGKPMWIVRMAPVKPELSGAHIRMPWVRAFGNLHRETQI